MKVSDENLNYFTYFNKLFFFNIDNLHASKKVILVKQR